MSNSFLHNTYAVLTVYISFYDAQAFDSIKYTYKDLPS